MLGLLLPTVLPSTMSMAQPDLESWSEMARQVVTARELLAGDVTNGVTPMGMVADFTLTPDLAEVEYLLFEVPYPVALWGAEDGFVAFEDVSFERTTGFDVEVRFDEEESLRRPEEFEPAGEALDRRLASRLLNQRAHFESGEALEIENLLIDPATGVVTHFVVETDPEAIIRSARRAVPAEEVEVGEDGRILVSLRADDLEDLQRFDPAFL